MREVRAAGQPPGLLDRRSGEHWAGRLYMRRLSPYVSWLAVRAGISANALTFLMIVVGLAGAGLIALPATAAALGGAALVQAYLLLDCSDGEVARWHRAESVRGVYLDRLGHYVVEAAVLVGAGARASDWGDPEWIILGLVGAIFALIQKAETDLVDTARHRAGLPPAADGATEMTTSGLARGRRLADYLPLHRITHAVEASLLLAVAAGADTALDGIPVTRGLVVAMVAVAGSVALLHLVSVLNSRRLADG